jgi:hypothetical protein
MSQPQRGEWSHPRRASARQRSRLRDCWRRSSQYQPRAPHVMDGAGGHQRHVLWRIRRVAGPCRRQRLLGALPLQLRPLIPIPNSRTQATSRATAVQRCMPTPTSPDATVRFNAAESPVQGTRLVDTALHGAGGAAAAVGAGHGASVPAHTEGSGTTTTVRAASAGALAELAMPASSDR